MRFVVGARVGFGWLVMVGCTSSTQSDAVADFAGTWKLEPGSTSMASCVIPGTSDLGGQQLTLTLDAPTSLVMTAITTSFTRVVWPASTCTQLLDLDIDGQKAATHTEPCGWQDAASGQGTWQVTVAPYSVTMQLDDPGTTLTIAGNQTIMNLNNGGGFCTATISATATR